MNNDYKKYYAPAGYALVFMVIELLLFFFVDRTVAEYTKALDATNPALINFFREITDLGKSKWYLIISFASALFCAFLARGKDVPLKYRLLFSYIGVRAIFVFATVALSGIVADIIKPIVGRARPTLWLRDGVFGFSPFTMKGFLWNGMPSGHTTTAFTLAFAFNFLYPRFKGLWLSFACLIACSRFMVDAHYLSDVCAGAALGTLTVYLSLKYGIIRLCKLVFPPDLVPISK